MTLTELRYIVAVARERHFGRAAEACFVSQPTLSVAVKKLEDELDVRLFERGSSEITVTPLGEEIVRQAQSVLEQAQAIKEIAKRGKDPLAGPLRLGVIYTIGPYLLPDLVRNAIALTPQMPLILQENFTVKLLEMLRAASSTVRFWPNPSWMQAWPPRLCTMNRSWLPCRAHTSWPSVSRSVPKSSSEKPCCCWERGTVSAIRCWMCALNSRAFPATPRASGAALKAHRWKPSSTWLLPAWA